MARDRLSWRVVDGLHMLEVPVFGVPLVYATVYQREASDTWVIKIPVLHLVYGGWENLREAKICAEKKVRQYLAKVDRR